MKKYLLLLLALLPLLGFSAPSELPELNYFGTYDLPGLTRPYIFGRTSLFLDDSPMTEVSGSYPSARLEASGHFLLHKDPRGRLPMGEISFEMALTIYEGGYSAAITNLTFSDEERKASLEGDAPEGVKASRWEVAVLQSDERIRRMLMELKDFVEDVPVYELEPVTIGEQRGIHLNAWKPVIYLYPEAETEVSVRLDFEGELDFTWPLYNKVGWSVLASPDGSLKNLTDGSHHQYLFWEGPFADNNWELESGYCVPGDEVLPFFQEILPDLGLRGQEVNDFITYWAPQLQGNAWNMISFPEAQYRRRAQLSVVPVPDTEIRVFMLAKALEAPVQLKKPVLKPIERKGFSLVEWGGSILPSPGI